MTSSSATLAAFAADLRYEDIPSLVTERAKELFSTGSVLRLPKECASDPRHPKLCSNDGPCWWRLRGPDHARAHVANVRRYGERRRQSFRRAG